jgi:hypothetical protein
VPVDWSLPLHLHLVGLRGPFGHRAWNFNQK